MDEKSKILISSGYAKDTLHAHIGDAIIQYDGNLSKDHVLVKYVPTRYQTSFLMSRNNIAIETIDVPGRYSLAEITAGITKLVKEQDVLRSYAQVDEKLGLLIYVNEYMGDWLIPVVEYKGKMDDAIEEYPDLFANGTLLVKIIIQEQSDHKFQIVIIAQHSVWDKTSTDIFKTRLVQHMNALASTNEDISPFYSYATGIQAEIHEEVGVDSTMLDVVHKWSYSIPKLERVNTMKIRVKLPNERIQEVLADPVQYAFKFTCYGLLGTTWSNYGDIPITAIHHGRSASNQNTLGMFLDVIPVVVNSCQVFNGDAKISSSIQNAISKMTEGKLYSQMVSERLMQYVDIIPCLNFVGVFADERDLDYLNNGEYKFTNYDVASFDVNIRIAGKTVEIIFPYEIERKDEIVAHVINELMKRKEK